MREQHDFRSARPNPYAKQLKKSITIRLDDPTIAYFRDMAEEMELPYQTLINLYLRTGAANGRRLSVCPCTLSHSVP